MQVNTSVVLALMRLRGLEPETLSKLAHIPYRDLVAWLSGIDDEDAVSFETQLEILNLVGVRDSGPRNDVVHYWKIHEALFSSAGNTYAELQTVLKAFGPAQAAYVAAESDPMLSLRAKAHFALKFPTFMVLLEISAHPLKSISFDPGTMPELSWVPGTQGVLLQEDEYLKLEPGAMKVRALTQCLTYSSEMTQWDQLRESAIEHGISAEQVATLLLGTGPKPVPIPGAQVKRQAPAAMPLPKTSTGGAAPQKAEPMSSDDMFSTPIR
jgi:hypothetical protein